ncbi:riboflavin biosynthesis protein RibF [Thermoleophilia bacterium SCSIO 60948]|nr:riboflavin biosynthesis protein RibF [Thermoleophilia bacterium SCSIO 60948]
MSIEVTALAEATPRPRRIAIGTFDGVHVGHRQVIRGADTVLTFEPHPLTVVKPEVAPKLLMTAEQKRDVLDGLGVEELVVIPFDDEFRARSAESFRDEILGERLGAVEVAVGENFRFGAGAKGDPAMIAERFETRIEPLIEIGGEIVSSTRIRNLIASGDVRAAMSCLGAPFLFDGTVVSGDKRGRTLGYPTANLTPDPELAVPGHGVYAAFANGHPAAVSIGVRPTFETGRELLVEAYLIDRDEDLYGQRLRLAFLERLRGEQRFDSSEALIRQMEADVATARDLCASFQPPAPRSRPANDAGTS